MLENKMLGNKIFQGNGFQNIFKMWNSLGKQNSRLRNLNIYIIKIHIQLAKLLLFLQD